ncbi:hypothetical protein [Paludibacterium purpuratum]|uniref:Flagella basal body P-ring formation protein FlgA n=1 Tax=Paludibacterium purpuratum TaxID=1144873 RepID=A0A4R7BCB3_9NEIS|nr:hypothetical protein [Paludibacterium purpuratum]TDR82700.1 hypothetical protein DFP86_10189 [Paludibacterium purpuratum]
MKRLLLLAALWLSGYSAWAGQTIALLPVIETSAAIPEALLDDTINLAFANTYRFTLIKPAQPKALLNKLKFPQTELLKADPAAVALVGKQAGADMVALVSVHHSISKTMHVAPSALVLTGMLAFSVNVYWDYPSLLTADMVLVDVNTGQVSDNIHVNDTYKNMMTNAAINESLEKFQVTLQREIADRYPLSAHIVKVRSAGEYLFDINACQAKEIGNKMIVYNDGKNSVDPVSGKVTKGERVILGVGKITQISGDIAVLEASGLDGAVEPGKTLVTPKL